LCGKDPSPSGAEKIPTHPAGLKRPDRGSAVPMNAKQPANRDGEVAAYALTGDGVAPR